MKADTDVIVIGAGPAGLSAAINLEKNDIEYLLFDSDIEPGEKKPCAGFIPIRTVKDMSIPKVSDQHEITSVRLQFSGKDPSIISFEEPIGINISRGALAKTMLDMTSNHDSQHLGYKVSKADTTNELCTVHTRKSEEVSTYTSRLIIDASGANPVTQRFIQLRPRISNSAMGYGLQYHLEFDKELPQTNSFLYGSQFSPSGYSWLFPRGKTMVFGTGGLVKIVRKNDRKTHEYLDHILKEVEPYSSELSPGNIIKKDAALMPLAGIVRPSYGRRIMLAGDAAGHCSPISGEGIHYSMIGGLLAAESAVRCIRRDDFSDNCLKTYEKKWTKKIGSDLKWGYWLQKRLMKPTSTNKSGWSSSEFIDSDKSQRIIAEMLVGKRSVRSAILSVAPSYLKSKIIK